MKAVAVVLAASLGFLTAGCTADKPVARSGSQSSEVSSDPDPDGSTSVAVAPTPQRVNAGSENVEVRDAKEAAEEAAKKIFNATAGAAAKIRDVSRGAVQAVRESAGRDSEAVNAEGVTEADSSKDPVGS